MGKRKRIKWQKVVAWVSDPPGVEVVADDVCVMVRANGQTLFALATVQGPATLIVPDVLVTSFDGTTGQPQEHTISGSRVASMCESFELQTNTGNVSLAEQLKAAWAQHQELLREVGRRGPELVG